MRMPNDALSSFIHHIQHVLTLAAISIFNHSKAPIISINLVKRTPHPYRWSMSRSYKRCPTNTTVIMSLPQNDSQQISQADPQCHRYHCCHCHLTRRRSRRWLEEVRIQHLQHLLILPDMIPTILRLVSLTFNPRTAFQLSEYLNMNTAKAQSSLPESVNTELNLLPYLQIHFISARTRNQWPPPF